MTQTPFKTCSSCGLQKPMSAFLQVAGPQGTTYGNVCADCRKAKMEKATKPKEAEEVSSSTSGERIGAKSRVHREMADKSQRASQTSLDELDKEKKEQKKIKITKSVVIKQKEEKQHRERYLQKSSFLSEKPEQKKQAAQKQQAEQSAKLEATKQEERLKGFDFTSGPYVAPAITGQVKATQGESFQRLKTWLGKGAPIAGAGAKPPAKDSPAKSKEPTPEEHVQQAFRPKTKK